MRFETKPGKSLATAGVFPSWRARSMIASAVSSEVSRPRTTSTSSSTGTGLKKCMPITRSGRWVTLAREVIGIEDVFEARIASAGSVRSARPKTSSLTSASSTTASTIRSAGTRSSTGWTRTSTSSAGGPPFSASLTRLFRIVSSPRSTAPGAASCNETRRPEAATTCAMPPPICPAPTTRTCSKRTAERLTCSAAVVRFELEVEIAKPVHEVWEYLIEPENVPEWQASAVSSHQISDGRMGVGTHLRDERRFLGRRAHSEVEVTEFEPERLFTLHGISGPVRFTVRHRLEQTGDGTHLHIEAEADPGGIGRLMRPVVEHAASHEIRKDFDRLKEKLEARGS